MCDKLIQNLFFGTVSKSPVATNTHGGLSCVTGTEHGRLGNCSLIAFWLREWGGGRLSAASQYGREHHNTNTTETVIGTGGCGLIASKGVPLNYLTTVQPSIQPALTIKFPPYNFWGDALKPESCNCHTVCYQELHSYKLKRWDC